MSNPVHSYKNNSELTISETSKILGVSTKTLRRWEISGKLKAERDANGYRMYKMSDLQKVTAVPSNKKNYIAPLALTVIMLCVGLGLQGSQGLTLKGQSAEGLTFTQANQPSVLAASDEATSPSVAGFTFAVNVPSKFSETVTFLKDIVAPNVVNSINNEVGDITIDNSLVAGSGISILDRTISNSGIVTLAAGTGIEIDGNKITNTYSFTPDYTQSGWTRTGTTVGLTTITDSVTVGALTIGGNTTISNGYSILPSTDLGSDLGSSTYRFNNLWVANINSNSSQSFSGQTTFSYPPTDTTINQASVLINPTTAAANGQLLGLAIAGYQRAVIDEDGDMILGYNSLTSAPATDYPLDIYGHSATRVSFVDTSGNAYFAGNVGIGTTSPTNAIHLGSAGSTTGGIAFGPNAYNKIYQWNDNDFRIVAGTSSSVSLQFTATAINLNASSFDRDIALMWDNGTALFSEGSSGNVGIGTTSPNTNLHVAGTTGLRVESQSGYYLDTKVTGATLTDFSTPYMSLNYNSAQRLNFGFQDSGASNNWGRGALFQSLVSGRGLTFALPLTSDFRVTGSTTGNSVSTDPVLFLINSSGNVGIGTTSPGEKLTIGGGNLKFISDGVGGAGQNRYLSYYPASDSSTYASINMISNFGPTVSSAYSAGFKFTTVDNTGSRVNVDALSILANGNVGIGTTSPSTKLHISGAGNQNVRITSTDNSTQTISFGDGNAYVERGGTGNLAFGNGGSTRMTLSNTLLTVNNGLSVGSLTTGTVYSNAGVLTNTDPSDVNLKTNVLSLPDGTLDKVLGLRTVSYNWKSTGDGALGFVAQEVQDIFPELVGTNNDGTLGLYTTQFIPLLTKAMQEQQLEVNKQKTKLDEFIAYIETVINGFKDRFRTKELCVGENGNETCVTKEQLDELLKLVPTPSAVSVATPSPESSPEATVVPTVSPSPTESPSPEPSPSSE